MTIRIVILLLAGCFLFTPILKAQKERSGIFISNSFSSLKRTESFPISPFVNNHVQNWEFGFYLPQSMTKNYFISARLSYLNYGFQETFQFENRQLTTSLNFQAVKLNFTPIGIKIPVAQTAFLFSAGGFASYHNGVTIDESTADFIFEDEIFERVVYGAQAEFGFRYKFVLLSINGYNSWSNIISASNITASNRNSIDVPDVPSKLRGVGISLTISLPQKSETKEN
jgi:hypothetical protein